MNFSLRNLSKFLPFNQNRNVSSVISHKVLNEEKFKNSSLIEKIRNEFFNYKGGTIDLIKDTNSGIASICINHPQRKNSFSGAMMAQLTDIIAELEEWREGKALIIYGSNNFFCSGGDLNTVRKIDDSNGGRRMSLLMHHNYSRLQSLPMISLAIVQGMAIGGGAEMTTACDYRLMTKDSLIGFVQIKIGITSAWGGGSRLTQLIGPQKALDMMTTGRTVDSEEALRIGLVDGIIEDNNNAINESKEWLKKYIKYSAETIRAAKGIVNGARYLPLQLALQEEIEHSASVWGGRAHKKALDDNIKHRL